MSPAYQDDAVVMELGSHARLANGVNATAKMPVEIPTIPAIILGDGCHRDCLLRPPGVDAVDVVTAAIGCCFSIPSSCSFQSLLLLLLARLLMVRNLRYNWVSILGAILPNAWIELNVAQA
jgi:hypothetical protein